MQTSRAFLTICSSLDPCSFWRAFFLKYAYGMTILVLLLRTHILWANHIGFTLMYYSHEGAPIYGTINSSSRRFLWTILTFEILTSEILVQVDSPELPEITEMMENFMKVTKYLTKFKETLIMFGKTLMSKSSGYRVFEYVLWQKTKTRCQKSTESFLNQKSTQW